MLSEVVGEALKTIEIKHNSSEVAPGVLLTKEEIAREFGVSQVTISKWMKKGLPFKKLSRRVYFDRNEVLKAMDKRLRAR